MLLSINEDKVAELLKSSGRGYSVYISDVPSVRIEEKSAYPMNYAASGVIYTASQLITAEAREGILEARLRIEESGVPLKDVDELTREVNEMRRKR